jgi:hypothetical protein
LKREEEMDVVMLRLKLIGFEETYRPHGGKKTILSNKMRAEESIVKMWNNFM